MYKVRETFTSVENNRMITAIRTYVLIAVIIFRLMRGADDGHHGEADHTGGQREV